MILQGDMLDEIPRLVTAGVVCDACVTDPPYHLLPTQRRFGADGSAPAQYGRDGAMARLSGGFMGQQWDGGDIAFRPDTWATVATVLRPGAFLVAFGGTRTYHRLASAIEDAGFVIQDTIAWIYGTGFPKRRDMLKPAFEPICLAYKPGGARTMQVDECRIETDEQWAASGVPIGGKTVTAYGDGLNNPGRSGSNTLGRWPANVCHDGSDEVVAGFPNSAGQLFATGPKYGDRKTVHCYGDYGPRPDTPPRGDTGSAARFFFSAKAGAEDRWGSRHPTVKPVELIRWMVRLVVPPGGTFLDPFAGSGTAAIAALAESRNAILIEREPQYVADIRERVAFYEGGGTHSVQAKNRNRTVDHGPLFFGGDS